MFCNYCQVVSRTNHCAHAHWSWVNIDKHTHSGKYNSRSDKYNKLCELQCIPKVKNHAFVDRDDYLVGNLTVFFIFMPETLVAFVSDSPLSGSPSITFSCAQVQAH